MIFATEKKRGIKTSLTGFEIKIVEWCLALLSRSVVYDLAGAAPMVDSLFHAAAGTDSEVLVHRVGAFRHGGLGHHLATGLGLGALVVPLHSFSGVVAHPFRAWRQK